MSEVSSPSKKRKSANTETSNKERKKAQRRDYKREFKRKKTKQLSSTPGSSKGGSCQASSLERFFAKYSRSHRDPGYTAWSESHRG